MPKMVDTRYTQDRELSWLRFDERVLEEARDEDVPLMERLKFAAIFTSNLDEFFMVRVGSLLSLIHIYLCTELLGVQGRDGIPPDALEQFRHAVQLQRRTEPAGKHLPVANE